MKRIAAIALVVLALCILGYGVFRNASTGTASEKIVCRSEVSAEDCCLCGNGIIEDMIPFYWGQNNIALISLESVLKPSKRRLEAPFSARTALIGLEIRQDSCVQSPCLTKKSTPIRHSASFKTDSKHI